MTLADAAVLFFQKITFLYNNTIPLFRLRNDLEILISQFKCKNTFLSFIFLNPQNRKETYFWLTLFKRVRLWSHNLFTLFFWIIFYFFSSLLFFSVVTKLCKNKDCCRVGKIKTKTKTWTQKKKFFAFDLLFARKKNKSKPNPQFFFLFSKKELKAKSKKCFFFVVAVNFLFFLQDDAFDFLSCAFFLLSGGRTVRIRLPGPDFSHQIKKYLKSSWWKYIRWIIDIHWGLVIQYSE